MTSAASIAYRTQSDRAQLANIRRPLRAVCSHPLLKPWEYRWDTLDPRTFQTYGVMAMRGPDSRPYFNFPQSFWPYPKVRMNWSGRLSRAVETLAANILLPFLRELRPELSGKGLQQLLMHLTHPFAESFLLTMPRNGGRIPREVIVEWIRDTI